MKPKQQNSIMLTIIITILVLVLVEKYILPKFAWYNNYQKFMEEMGKKTAQLFKK